MTVKEFFSPIYDKLPDSNRKSIIILRAVAFAILWLPPAIYSLYATKFLYVIISIIIDACVIAILYCGIVHRLTKKRFSH